MILGEVKKGSYLYSVTFAGITKWQVKELSVVFDEKGFIKVHALLATVLMNRVNQVWEVDDIGKLRSLCNSEVQAKEEWNHLVERSRKESVK